MSGDMYVVLSPTVSGNALGRALSMALVARELGEVIVFAPPGAPWSGSSQFPFTVEPFPRNKLTWARDVRERAHGRDVVVWSCKSFSPLPSFVSSLRSVLPDTLVICDFDDDDVELSREHTAISARNRFKLNPLRRGSPERVSRAQSLMVSLSSARTVATWTLASHVPGGELPTAWIPHVREFSTKHSPGPLRAEAEHTVRVGFLGTWRPHKGAALSDALASNFPAIEVVTFAQPGVIARPGLRTIPPGTPLSDAYGLIDVLALPMDDSGASDRQFPAKLVDGFKAGVPVLGSPTSALSEVGGSDSYVPRRLVQCGRDNK